ncbi:MAG: leucyl aminopeptidase family protein [Planctomycetes bacterium]|nr:leucyl aminopeptidase family protein [Planctomycetota bacterium]
MFDSIRYSAKSSKTATLVVGVFASDSKTPGTKPTLDAATARIVAAAGASDAVKSAISRPEFEGAMGSSVEAFAGSGGKTRVIVVGLGKAEKLATETLRFVGGVIGRKLAAAKSEGAVIELSSAVATAVKASGAAISAGAAGSAVGEGLGLIGWVCDEFKGSVTKKKDAKGKEVTSRTKLDVASSDAKFGDGVERGLGLAVSANFCRTLSQTPPNIATTSYMAQQARSMAKKVGLKYSVMEGAALERENMTGLINVGKASENKPCLVRLEYSPKGKNKNAKPLVLIGKTMTYDTGGLSLKINNGMVGMKRDKDGGCAVLGAMHAIATVIQPNRPVVALLSIAENSISDEAYRPDDVITYRNGVTVEVTNTDAEGRLVLADALCWACEKEDPSAIIDLATLTGGVVVALGSTYAGMFCENDALRAKVEAASKASGERVWRLPMHQEYQDLMKSPVADIQNSNANRKAHPIQGAAFLAYFVDEKIPWCHLDIAGVHVADGNKGAFVDGPTGWGTRLLAELVDA